MRHAAVRTRRGELWVAVDRWRRSDRTALIVGMVHVADPAFYTAVAALVAEHETRGYQVFYERTALANPDPTPTAAEVALIERLRPLDLGRIMARLLGLARQHDPGGPLALRNRWRNTDLSMTAMLRAIPDPERFVAGHERMVGVLGGALGEHPDVARAFGRIMHWVLRHLPRLAPVLAVAQAVLPRERPARRVLIDRRNGVAVEAILTHPGDVVALWGAGHLPGIGKMLEMHGYTRVQRTWYRAIRRPS